MAITILQKFINCYQEKLSPLFMDSPLCLYLKILPGVTCKNKIFRFMVEFAGVGNNFVFLNNFKAFGLTIFINIAKQKSFLLNDLLLSKIRSSVASEKWSFNLNSSNHWRWQNFCKEIVVVSNFGLMPSNWNCFQNQSSLT